MTKVQAPAQSRVVLADLQHLVGMRSEEVIRRLGNPDTATHRLWKYPASHKVLWNPVTGAWDTLCVYFKDDVVVEVR